MGVGGDGEGEEIDPIEREERVAPGPELVEDVEGVGRGSLQKETLGGEAVMVEGDEEVLAGDGEERSAQGGGSVGDLQLELREQVEEGEPSAHRRS